MIHDILHRHNYLSALIPEMLGFKERVMKHTGFHEYKDGVRFNPDCPACQYGDEDKQYTLGSSIVRDGQPFRYVKMGCSLETLAKIRDEKQNELEYILSIANIPNRIV